MNSPVNLFSSVCLFCVFLVCEIRPVPAKDSVHSGSGPFAVDPGNHEDRYIVVALDFKVPSTSDPDVLFYSSLRKSVASTLNRMLLDSADQGHLVRPGRLEGSGRKSEWEYTIEDVAVIEVSPVPATYANLRIRLRVHRKGGAHLSSVDDVSQAIRREEKSISDRVGLPLVSVLPDGLSSKRGRRVPRAEDSGATQTQERPDNIWEAHRWLFIAIIIFIGFSILLTIICCICLRCRRKSSARNKAQEDAKEDPTHVVSSSPGLMQEQSPPNEPPPIDEENGWIIPLDQMTKEELEQPEVQVSRL